MNKNLFSWKIFSIFLFLFSLNGTISSLQAKVSAVISSLEGKVEIQMGTEVSWRMAKLWESLSANTCLRTGPRSSVMVEFSTGKRSKVGPQTEIEIRQLLEKIQSIKLKQGSVRSWIKKLANNEEFSVETPVAVCAVRGTDFLVEVETEQKTRLRVFSGVVGVRRIDGIGEEIRVNPLEESIIQGDTSPGEPHPFQLEEGVVPSQARSYAALSRDAALRQEISREVQLDMSQEEVLQAAAAEVSRAEYQEGKTMIDAFGKRVRVEEYVLRPNPEQYKLVVLNSRSERFDYFYMINTFNKPLPDDVHEATRTMFSKEGEEPPEYYLKSREWGMSNTQDNIESSAQGGELVRFVRGQPEYIYNRDSGKLELKSEGSVYWETLFQEFTYRINGILKESWSLTNSGSYQYYYPGQTTSDYYFEQVTAGKQHYRENFSYGDGTWERWETLVIDDQGELAAEAGAFSSLAEREQELRRWNYQTVVTASEFSGRKIDLVITPGILFDSGFWEE